jgi:hypothetical protein
MPAKRTHLLNVRALPHWQLIHSRQHTPNEHIHRDLSLICSSSQLASLAGCHPLLLLLLLAAQQPCSICLSRGGGCKGRI